MGENGSYNIVTPMDEQYEIPALFDINTGYKYEDEDLENILAKADPGNAGVTEEMKNYVPAESMMVSSCGKYRQRLIFYNITFEEEEIEMINSFKAFCVEKKVKIP